MGAQNANGHTVAFATQDLVDPASCRVEIVDEAEEVVGSSDWVDVQPGTDRRVRVTVRAPAGTYRAFQLQGGVAKRLELESIKQPETYVLEQPDAIYRAFTADEMKQLEAFVANVRKLVGMRFFRQVPKQLKVSWDLESGMNSAMDHPDDEDTAAAVAKFRQIFNANEPTSYKAAIDTLTTNIRERGAERAEEAIDALADHRRIERRVLRDGIGIGITLDSGTAQRALSPREILDAYFHGEYLHSGNDKARLVETLEQLDGVARLTLYSTMERAAQVYWIGANVVELALGRRPNQGA